MRKQRLNTLIMEGTFDMNLFSNEVLSIQKLNNYAHQEYYYRKIGISILELYSGYKNVIEFPTEIKGTPFDIVIIQDNDIVLVELKGSLNYFNKPDKTQLARFQRIIQHLEPNDYQIKGYLLQVNISKLTFRIHDLIKIIEQLNFDNHKLGQKTPIENIIVKLNEIIKAKTNN